MAAPPPYDVLLFDLGGVLVELAGLPTWGRWTGESDEARIWATWLRSPAVRRFESGASHAQEFADDIVREFELPISPAEFLRAFESWPTGTFPGALELLAALRGRFEVACLSNTNELHWPRFLGEFKLAGAFDHAFASHELGLLKPDRAVFERVLDELGREPERVLLLDDNALNIDAARSVGLHAERVCGVEGARARLEELGLLAGVRLGT